MPKLPCFPSEVSHSICKRRTTPWKLKEILKEYQECYGDEMKALIALLIVWCVMPKILGALIDRIRMALSLPPISLPSENRQRATAARLDATLGTQMPP